MGAPFALIANGFPVIFGGVLGILIGTVLAVPHRMTLRDLVLSSTDAMTILDAERDRRTGVAALSPQERAAHETA